MESVQHLETVSQWYVQFTYYNVVASLIDHNAAIVKLVA